MESAAKNFSWRRMLAITAVALMGMALMSPPAAAAGDIVRTELSRSEFSESATMEIIVARLEIPPGATIPRHFHHGDEHVIVVQGASATLESGKVINFETGAGIHFPAAQVHGGFTVTGKNPLIVYTIHVVEKGRPLMNPVE